MQMSQRGNEAMSSTRHTDGVHRHERLDGQTVPTWKICVPVQAFSGRLYPIQTLHTIGGRELLLAAFRGAAISRLDTVLKTGVDIDRPDGVLYVSEFSKAWEYGESPKMMLAFDRRKLDSTYREVDSNLSQSELAALRSTFPTEVARTDGTKLWLSRLSSDDPRVTTLYEIEYARWIPGNPFEALLAILIFHADEMQ